jgi:CDP-diacylglycerol pyrophosphatase
VSLNLYLDIQNVYNFKARTAPIILVERDQNGAPLQDPNDPSRYLLKSIDNTSGIIQPSIGIILEFKLSNSKK